jgi:hypothetical protein
MKRFYILLLTAGFLFPTSASIIYKPNQIIIPPFAQSGAPIPSSEHPLAKQINSFLVAQKNYTGFKPTGLNKNTYLSLINKQVRYFMTKQQSDGKVGDAYATGGFILAATVCYVSGKDHTPEVLQSIVKAMDFTTDYLLKSVDIMRAWRNDPAGKSNPYTYTDFYMYPVMIAYEQLKKYGPADKVKIWGEKLRRYSPEGYNLYMTHANNWPVVHMAGEYLRTLQGFTDLNYSEWVLETQKYHMTNYGMYLEFGAPFAYDGFSRYFLTGILHRGYTGKNHDFYRTQCWKGAWTSLLCQSPAGELPTGYRSAHHIWNEAEIAVINEIYAAHYYKLGRVNEAGAFKRSARLALKSLTRWVRPEGYAYIVKNRYGPTSQPFAANPQSTYSLLGAHMMALAYLVLDDTIPELPAPADVGGFVFHIPQFNSVFANAGGAYIQYMTRGNHAYNGNPTGLIRIHLRGSNPQLGPSDGIVDTKNANGIHDLSVGPAWKLASGKEVRLAEFPDTSLYRVREANPVEQPQPTITINSETLASVSFTVRYPSWNGALVSEVMTLNNTGLTGKSTVNGAGISSIRLYYPMLQFDGLENTVVALSNNTVKMNLRKDSLQFSVVSPSGVQLKRAPYTKMSWNGQMQPLYADIAARGVIYKISIPGRSTLPKGEMEAEDESSIFSESGELLEMQPIGLSKNSDNLVIRLNRVNNNTVVNIFSLNGRLVYNANFSQVQNMIADLRNLESGMYLVKISSDNNTIQQPLHIMK